MRDALLLLASAAEGNGGSAAALDALRARWPELSREEQAALTPVAKLLADRAAAAAAPPRDEAPPPVPAAPSDASPPAPRGSGATPEALLARFGLAEFRPGQREAVAAALDGRDSLVVMPTGGGKSLCYQLPGIASDGLTVIVSPLIALMRDQCDRLTGLGHPAVMLASGQEEDNRTALERIRDGRAQIVFAAPERFASGAFRAALARRDLALFVVDEAHCVSEWGHDFRPDYLRLRPVIDELGRPPVMACTATATPKVADEIVARLGLREPERVRSGFDRPNLSFDVVPFDGEGSVARKRGQLVAGLQMPENRPAVVYCGTRKSTEETAERLGAAGLSAVAYHAGMGAQARADNQLAFMRGDADVVVATNAFGMGVDKADVRSVWHWALPSSLESYYQEAGRAGRDGAPARAVLLASRSDLGRLVRFIREAEVTVDQVGALVARLAARAERSGEASAGGEASGRDRKGPGRGTSGVLELDGPGDDRDRVALSVAEQAGALTLAPGSRGGMRIELADRGLDAPAAARLCRAAANRRWESYRSIERFAATADVCRRRQILDHFGDATPARASGRCCDVCDPPEWLPAVTVKPRRAPAPPEEGREVSDAELAPLKEWRRERADGKPAYTVATDATLREIVRREPATERELIAIKGIGPSFVERHSESLLALLAAR